jgi:hypothetical protein
MEEGYAAGRPDVELYRQRRTLDLYWQRNSSTGVAATLQVAHAFLGLRLECAQCHRHPHDVWQQDDLLSFANFFMPVRKIGFQGDNEKKFPAVAAVFKRMNEESKAFTEEAKKLRENDFKKLEAKARTARTEADRLGRELVKLEKDAEQATAAAKAKRAESEKNAGRAEQLRKEADDLDAKAKQAVEKCKPLRPSLAMHQATLAEMEKMRKRLAEMEHRGRSISEAARRVMHAEVCLLEPGKSFATVTSPIGTQSSKRYRLLGQTEDITIAKEEDPRRIVMAWLRRPDNPYFAKAIVNRVWASYFGRGIIDPPDNLSSFNPPSHPELLQELSRAFIEHQYDLKWLHRTILRTRTYQQSSMAGKDNDADRANYAYFYYRRLPAEVLVDALNQATGTTEKMDMDYFFWPANLKTVEAPYTPRNTFVTFMLANFGKPKRNSAVQCDCERDGNPSVLQVLSFANHPRVWAKIADDKGRIARILQEFSDEDRRIEEIFLVSVGRLPRDSEMRACREHLRQSSSPARGFQGILWSLLNTREFVLQH